jgi:putative transposase
VSVARFVADQRTMHRVPHTVTAAILGISVSWFYKWCGRGPTDGDRRRASLDAKVREMFEASKRTTVRLVSTLTCSRPVRRSV